MANLAAQLAAVLQACIKRSGGPKPSRAHARAAGCAQSVVAGQAPVH